MTATIINGKSLADAVLANLKTQIDALGVPLHLAAVCASEDSGLHAFIKLKQKAAQSIGITFSSYIFDGKNQQEVEDALKYLAKDDSVDGIFIELPLPQSWDTDALVSLIPLEKDADALRVGALVPEPAVLALRYVLDEYGITVRGMSVAVIGQGRLVGQPISRWLGDQGARVQEIDIDTANPASIAQGAELIVTGVGKPGLVTGEWVKEGAAVVDFGYGKTNPPTGGGAYVGDVDAESVIPKAALLTPVPGGMGPLVIAAVLENVLTLAQR